MVEELFTAISTIALQPKPNLDEKHENATQITIPWLIIALVYAEKQRKKPTTC